MTLSEWSVDHVEAKSTSHLVMVKAACDLQKRLCGHLTLFRDDLYGIGDLNSYLRRQYAPRRRRITTAVLARIARSVRSDQLST
jgi:hypothetical protein